MTKSELIDAIAEKAGLSKTDATKALAATLESVTDALKSGEKVALIGFGTFSVSPRAARTGKTLKQVKRLPSRLQMQQNLKLASSSRMP